MCGPRQPWRGCSRCTRCTSSPWPGSPSARTCFPRSGGWRRSIYMRGGAAAALAGRLAALLTASALALLSKPMAVTPAVRAAARRHLASSAMEPWLIAERWAGFRRRLLVTWPVFLMAAAVCVVTFFVQRQAGAVQSAEAFPWVMRLANVPVAYATYLLKMIWPVDLAPLYPYPESIPVLRSLGGTRAARPHHGGRGPRADSAADAAGRVALVSRHTRAGRGIRAGRRAAVRRSLHLRAAHGRVPDDRVDDRRCGRARAGAHPGRDVCGSRGCAPRYAHVSPGRAMARQRHLMDAYGRGDRARTTAPTPIWDLRWPKPSRLPAPKRRIAKPFA